MKFKFKFDKDLLLKYQFWILLTVVLLLWGTAVGLATFALSDGDGKQKYESAKKDLEGLRDFKNDKFTQALTNKTNTLDEKKKSVWLEEWEAQKGILVWPKPVTGELNDIQYEMHKAIHNEQFGIDYDATHRLIEASRRYRRDFGKIHLAHLENLKLDEAIKPAYFLGGWKSAMKFPDWGTIPPTMEECWYTVEDMCIRQEMLNTVQSLIENAAKLRAFGTFKKLEQFSADPLGPHGYQHPFWRLDVLFEKQAAAVDPVAGALADTKNPNQAVSLSKATKLTNIRSDSQIAPIDGLKLRFSQKIVDKESKQEKTVPPVELTLKGADMRSNAPFDLAELGLADKLELPGFAADMPLIVELIDDARKPKDVAQWRILRNTTWQMELHVESSTSGTKLKATSLLTNIHPSRRQIPMRGLEMVLSQGQQRKTILLQGEPAVWNKPIQLSDAGHKEGLVLDRFNAKDPIEVLEVLNWGSSPIKRIDALEVGFASHLHVDRKAQVRKMDRPARDSTAKPVDPNTTTTSTTQQPPPAEGTAPGAAVVPMNVTSNTYKIPRARYLRLTDQVRRLPVLVVLTIEQAQAQQVLGAFTPANSKLRFYQTQVVWKHAREVTSPSVDAVPKEGAGAVPVATPTSPAGGGEEEDPNLIELQIYGVVSLYEMPPEPTPDAKAPQGGAVPIPGK